MNHRPSSSSSSSKTRIKCSPAPNTADSKSGRRIKQSHRSPLKEHNIVITTSSSSSSSSCSTSSVISNEAPKGCLRFFLSNSSSSSSSSSRTPLYNRPTRTMAKTPKSAPNVRRPSTLSRSKLSKENRSKPVISANQERPTSQKLQKFKNSTPCLYQLQQQYGKKPSFRFSQKTQPSPNSNISGISVNKLASDEPGELEQQQQLECLARRAGEATTDLGGLPDIKDVNFTPASKLPFGSALDCAFLDKAIDENSNTNITTTPPVEASVSPEIQCGLLPLMSTTTTTTTPICYGAGHVISGVTDKRKCKPRGILTIGEKSLEFDKVKILDDDDEILGGISNSTVSLVPLPIEASVHWLLSPCKEQDDVPNGLCVNGLNQFRRLISSSNAHSPSPSSGHGFCFNVCNSSSKASPGTTTTTTSSTSRRRRRSNSLLSPSGLSEWENLFCPLSDDVEVCSLPPSPHATPTCKDISLEEENKYWYDHAEKNSPLSQNSLCSGNVIQTPQSDSSPDRVIRPCLVNAKHLFESELDSVAEVLQRTTSFSPKSQRSMWDPAGTSFQFDHLTSPSNSIDFMQLQKTWDQASWICNSTLENVSQSQIRISWREGLVSRIFEMDELDCCRCLSDEEEDANGCSNVPYTSHLTPERNPDDQILPNASGSPEFVGHEKEIDERGGEEFSLQGPSSCAESISTDGGGLLASGDSDWTLCYRNRLFEV